MSKDDESVMHFMELARSLFFFLLAGLCEIGGGYLMWLSIRSGKGLWLAVICGAVLILYGIIPTFQPASFGRVYAAYGGIFIVLSILWGWQIDKIVPDRFDLIGGIIALEWRDRHYVLAARLTRTLLKLDPDR